MYFTSDTLFLKCVHQGTRLAIVSWCKKIKVILISKFLLETYCFVQSFLSSDSRLTP